MLGDVGDLDVASELDTRVTLEVGAQQCLELGLVEHIGLREAVNAAGGIAVELGQHAHGVIEQPQPERGSGDRRELVGDSEARHDTEDLVVHVHGTGLRIHTCPAVEHEATNAVLRQQRCGRDAGRAGTDDDDRR